MHENKNFNRVMLALCFASSATMANAGPKELCQQLKTIIAAAPTFASLRGAPEGSEFDGALLIETATQCKLRNKSDMDENWRPINDKWDYECLWEDRAPEALAALQGLVKSCLGTQATFSEGSPLGRKYPNYTGGVFQVGGTSIVVDFNKQTNQLWLSVLPDGVEQ
jgi:hypothetical protein